MRQVTIPDGSKHTHAGQTYYGPCVITLPDEDAIELARLVVSARIEAQEEAVKAKSMFARDNE